MFPFLESNGDVAAAPSRPDEPVIGGCWCMVVLQAHANSQTREPRTLRQPSRSQEEESLLARPLTLRVEQALDLTWAVRWLCAAKRAVPLCSLV